MASFLRFAKLVPAAAAGAICATATVNSSAPSVPAHGEWTVADVQYSLAQYFDHTALKASTTASDIEKLCDQAAKYHFKTVCVNGAWVAFARAALDSRGAGRVKVCSVVGFPLGAGASRAKAAEAAAAIEDGAEEIDMVISVGHLHSGAEGLSYVMRDIAAVSTVTHDAGVPLKVILETCLLSKQEIESLTDACRALGVEWVKTSTGFSNGGAQVDDVALMHARGVDSAVAFAPSEVKASGGIRTLNDALGMIKAGATRIGASAGVSIMRELEDLQETSAATALQMLQDDGVQLQKSPERRT